MRNLALSRALKKWIRGCKKLVVVGVGNELKGDDAVGVLILRESKQIVGANEKVVFVDGGVAPENYLGALKKIHPTHVLFVDAAVVSRAKLVESERVADVLPSTHMGSLSLMLDELKPAKRAVLCAPAERREWGAKLSKRSERARKEVISLLIPFLSKYRINPARGAEQANVV